MAVGAVGAALEVAALASLVAACGVAVAGGDGWVGLVLVGCCFFVFFVHCGVSLFDKSGVPQWTVGTALTITVDTGLTSVARGLS